MRIIIRILMLALLNPTAKKVTLTQANVEKQATFCKKMKAASLDSLK